MQVLERHRCAPQSLFRLLPPEMSSPSRLPKCPPAPGPPHPRTAPIPGDPRPGPDPILTLFAGVLGIDAASRILSYLACQRCQTPCSDTSACEVPHRGSSHIPYLSRRGGPPTLEGRDCQACGAAYWVSGIAAVGADRANAGDAVNGTLLCYSGRHSSQALPSADLRRRVSRKPRFKVRHALHNDLETLPGDVTSLTVFDRSEGGRMFCEEHPSERFIIDRSFPMLEEIVLVNGPLFSKIVLNEQLAPRLVSVALGGLSSECEVSIVIPLLEKLTIHDWAAKSDVINAILRVATHLSFFSSHKLAAQDLHFASNCLHHVDLHCAESLQSLSLWAPALTFLRIQSCTSLKRINFLDEHPLKAGLNVALEPPLLRVQAYDSSIDEASRSFEEIRLSCSVAQVLDEHPRCSVKYRSPGEANYWGTDPISKFNCVDPFSEMDRTEHLEEWYDDAEAEDHDFEWDDQMLDEEMYIDEDGAMLDDDYDDDF